MMKPAYCHHRFEVWQQGDKWHVHLCDHMGRVIAQPPSPYQRKHYATEWAHTLGRKVDEAITVIREGMVAGEA